MESKFVLYYIVLLILIMTACKVSEKDSNDLGRHRKKTFKLSGKITYTSDYCGGPPPSSIILDRLAIPSPYLGKTFYIRAGERNNLSSPILCTFVTDSLGNYSIELPQGNYCIIDEFRKDTSFMTDIYKVDPYNYIHVENSECLKEWFNSCFYGFAISNHNITNVNFNIHRICFRPEGVPCISYNGPIPQ